ncbi:heme peroxidase [Fimicolochytrium jonesii]|uniref:heme peroxidase n=1 Tax=Fimicolochytrium jonesii TaxID=1396493 RepID=UPI0022FE015B|nr:heme peroxidase [Fimicolochytrium jonesii]KAI8817011.1 heme peroxidase [Fimicolochytrium jonesii]
MPVIAFARAVAAALGSRWWQKGMLAGLIYLSATRDSMEKNNLHDSYTAVDYPQANCSSAARFARSLDGTCNDLQKPAMGSVGYRFGRNVRLENVPQGNVGLFEPNPRQIGQKLLLRDTFKPATSINLFVLAWIQFQVHDWMDHERAWGSPVNVPLPEGDPLEGTGQRIYLPRSVADPDMKTPGRPKAFKNQVTHWWDMSQIYGTTAEINRRIRGTDGKLKVDADGLLPLDSDGMEVTGFKDNWWSGLALLHTIWTREHNSICDMFKAKHPEWTDQKLFDMARLVTTAINAKIHTVEWTPGILQNEILRTAMQTNWDGILPDLLDNWPGGPILTGIVGGKKDLKGVPFSLTEEFTAVYRLHSLLPDTIEIWDAQSKKLSGRVYELPSITFKGSRRMIAENKLADVVYTFGTANPGALTLNNYPAWLMNLTKPNEPHVVDMATTEIYRDRERGIPRYLQFRREIGLKPDFKTFADINPDKKVQALLQSVYRVPEDVDLLVGTLAEEPRPDGYGFGDTAFHIFILMASRRLFTDRFLTDDYKPEIYTAEGIKYIETQGNFKGLISRHFPELASAVNSVDNPFKPWKL